MIKRFLLPTLCAIVLGGTRHPLFAQTRVDSTKVYSIDKVSVTNRRIDREVIPAQVLAGEELGRLGAVSVADAIRYFSGVQIKDYGGIGGLKTVNIRSLGTQHVGVFYDGVQLGNAQNGQIDLGRFSMDNMEAILLYNGQKSGISQSAKDFASAGSIYLQTRRPEFKEGKRDNLRLALKGGSFGTINPSVLWEHRFGKKLDGQLSAEYLYTTGRYKFRYRTQNGYDTTAMRRNGDVKALRGEGGLFGRLRKGDWRAKIYFYDSARGYPGAFVREKPGEFRHEDRQKDMNIFAQSSLRQYFGRYNLMLNAKYAYDKMHYIAPIENITTTLANNDRYYQQEAYFSAANEVRIFEWWLVDLSCDFQFNTLDARLLNNQEGFAHPSRYTALTAAATAVEFKRFKFQASVLYTHVTDRTRKPGGQAGDKDKWTPTAVVMYKPFRKAALSLRAFYKHIFRMPTFNDLYYTMLGNKYLDPEYTTQYNIGTVYSKDLARGWFRRLNVQIDGYFNQVRNKIIAMPTSNQFQWTMMNLGYVEIRGVDAALQAGFQFGKVSIDTRLNYTYQRAQDFTDKKDDYYGGQIAYIPRHSGSAIIAAVWRGWDLNYSFIYTGQRYQKSANILENWSPPWFTHDLSLAKKIRLKKSELRVTAEINNIFNQPYEVVRSYPMPGTNFKIKIGWTL